jgi:hypothetical protein
MGWFNKSTKEDEIEQLKESNRKQLKEINMLKALGKKYKFRLYRVERCIEDLCTLVSQHSSANTDVTQTVRSTKMTKVSKSRKQSNSKKISVNKRIKVPKKTGEITNPKSLEIIAAIESTFDLDKSLKKHGNFVSITNILLACGYEKIFNPYREDIKVHFYRRGLTLSDRGPLGYYVFLR